MIYRSSYLKKELRQSYIENKTGNMRMLVICLLLALITIAVHSCLQTLYASAITEVFPQIMLPSYFAIASTYAIIAVIFFFCYFTFNYYSVTFAEIKKNRWYMLNKMGYSPSRMICAKTLSAIFISVVMYTGGFLISLLLAGVFKYTFVMDYLIPVYLCGLLDLVSIISFLLLISLFIASKRNAAYLGICFIIFLLILKSATGYYSIVSDIKLMSVTGSLFDSTLSIYSFIVLGLIIVCLIMSALIARKHANYYSVNSVAPEDELRVDYKTDKISKSYSIWRRVLIKAISVVIKVALVAMIAAFVFVNVTVLVASLGAQGGNFTVMGYIPYIFQSTTMEEEIMQNDLVLFKEANPEQKLQVGDIVLFTDSEGLPAIEKITEVHSGAYRVDITAYPPDAEPDSMNQLISTRAVYGVLALSSGGLGTLIMFSNSTFGKVIMLLIPILLLFFYKPIENALNRRRDSMQE